YARLVCQWIADIGLDPSFSGTHWLRRTKATLIYRHLRAVQLLLGHKNYPGRANLLCPSILVRPIADVFQASQTTLVDPRAGFRAMSQLRWSGDSREMHRPSRARSVRSDGRPAKILFRVDLRGTSNARGRTSPERLVTAPLYQQGTGALGRGTS